MLKIYLAGPDVFSPSAIQQGRYLQTLCTNYGFCGLYPVDSDASSIGCATDKLDMARAIFRGNIQMIQSADIVMANLSNFRGAEPDSGTAFEVGFAFACGKPVFGYTSSGLTTVDRVAHIMAISKGIDGVYRDNHGFSIENFGLPANLMLAIGAKIVHGGPEECLQLIASVYPSFATQSFHSLLN